MKNVVVMGKGSLAVDIMLDLWARTDFKVEAVVPSTPEPEWAESLSDWARIYDIPVVESGDHVDLLTRDGAFSWPYDLIISVFYSEIVSPHFLQNCRRRETEVVNLHNAPLPKYRGVNPVNWALKNGEDEHGVTIHRMVSDVDAGPIYGQVRFSIYPETDEVIDVYRRCLRYGKALAEETLPRLDEITPVKQNHEEATYYSTEDRSSLYEREDFLRPDSDKSLDDYPVGNL